MGTQVKSYNRHSKKGVTIVNSFYRKGNKKKKNNQVLKTVALGALGTGVLATALVGGKLLLKKEGINTTALHVPEVKTVTLPSTVTTTAKLPIPTKAVTIPDPWLASTTTAKPLKIDMPQVSTSPQKLLPPAKVVPVQSKPFITLEGKQYNGIQRSHGKLRTVHKQGIAWDKQLVTDKSVLELAKSTGKGSLFDRQRAVGIFKQKQQERELYRKAIQKSKQISLKAEKTVGLTTKRRVTVNSTAKLEEFIDKFNSTKNSVKSDNVSIAKRVGIATAQLKHQIIRAKDQAEGATIKRVKGTRRDLLTAFVPKTLNQSSTTVDIEKLAKQQYVKGKQLLNTNKASISEIQTTVSKAISSAKEQQSRLSKVVKDKLSSNEQLIGLQNLAPKNETVANLIKSGKKEAKKNIEIQALNIVNPILGKAHYITEDIKGRVDQLNRYSNELEATGEKVLNRRQLIKNTGKKVVKEASKKPKDAYYTTRGTDTKTRIVLKNRAGQVEQSANSGQQYGGQFYSLHRPSTLRNIVGNFDPQVYTRRPLKAYSPTRGLLSRLAQANEKFARWKSGNLKH